MKCTTPYRKIFQYQIDAKLRSLNIERAKRYIKYAWIVGALNFVLLLFSALALSRSGRVTPATIAEPIIVGLLTLGIYKKNEYCAGVFIGYVILSKIVAILLIGFKIQAILGGLIALVFLYDGMLGAMKYWRVNEAEGKKTKQARLVYGATLGSAAVALLVWIVYTYVKA